MEAFRMEYLTTMGRALAGVLLVSVLALLALRMPPMLLAIETLSMLSPTGPRRRRVSTGGWPSGVQPSGSSEIGVLLWELWTIWRLVQDGDGPDTVVDELVLGTGGGGVGGGTFPPPPPEGPAAAAAAELLVLDEEDPEAKPGTVGGDRGPRLAGVAFCAGGTVRLVSTSPDDPGPTPVTVVLLAREGTVKAKRDRKYSTSTRSLLHNRHDLTD